MISMKILLINIDSFEEDDLFPYVEHANLARFTNERTKKEKAASLYFKNRFVKSYFYNDYGKPVSAHKHFSITHSHGLVCYIEGPTDIGIDIEQIREVNQNLIDRVLSDEEKEQLNDEEDFFIMWTNKEAVAKADGQGIIGNIKKIPALPLIGKRTYKNKGYINKYIKYKDYIISVSLLGDKDFELETKEIKFY